LKVAPNGVLGKGRGNLVGKYICPHNCAFSDNSGPDVTRRAVAFCMDIAVCHKRKFGQVWGSQLPYQTSMENSAAGRHPFGPSATTRNNRNHSAMYPWAGGWSP